MKSIGRYVNWLKGRAQRTGIALGVAVCSFMLMASRPPAETLYTVRIHEGGKTFQLLTEPMTLSRRFLESRIWISRFDKVVPSLSTPIRQDMDVWIHRDDALTLRADIAESPVQSEKIIYSNRIPVGRRIKIFSGPSDIVLVGAGRKTPKQKVFHLSATAYSPDIRDCWPYSAGITAIGLKAGYGVAAIDPRVIPLGSRIYVEGYGYAIASDLGGAIRGREIDLCFDSHEEAKVFGRRPVKVYLLD